MLVCRLLGVACGVTVATDRLALAVAIAAFIRSVPLCRSLLFRCCCVLCVVVVCLLLGMCRLFRVVWCVLLAVCNLLCVASCACLGCCVLCCCAGHCSLPGVCSLLCGNCLVRARVRYVSPSAVSVLFFGCRLSVWVVFVVVGCCYLLCIVRFCAVYS